jgi:tyrosinase
VEQQQKRINHRDLDEDNKKLFVSAIIKLKNDVDSVLHPGQQKRYDDFVEVHKNAMMGPGMFHPMPHGSSLFYPWHRVLLRQFELALQEAIQDNSITIPYWDWKMTGQSNPFTPDFMGGDGDAAENRRVVDGPFAFSTSRFDIRVWDGSTGDAALRREFGEDNTSWLPTEAEVTEGLGKAPYWPGPNTWEVVSEGMLHNPVHRWVGGNMADATSPNDPIFFLHHCYLDLLWEKWKAQHPTSAPYRPEHSAMYGLEATLVFNASGEPAPWTRTWKVGDTIKTSDMGYTYA